MSDDPHKAMREHHDKARVLLEEMQPLKAHLGELERRWDYHQAEAQRAFRKIMDSPSPVSS